MSEVGPQHRWQWRRTALLFAAAALLLRMLVPAGWMPSTSASGISLRWCSEGSGLVAETQARAMLADALGDQKAPAHAPGSPDGTCAFAATPLAAAAPGPSPPPPAAPRAAERFVALPASFPGRGLVAPPPPQTGPPAFA